MTKKNKKLFITIHPSGKNQSINAAELMKRLLLILTVFFSSFSQAQQWNWLKDIGETTTFPSVLAIGNSGDIFALVGHTGTGYNRYVERYNAAGNLIWSRAWDVFQSIAVYPNNDFAVVGGLGKAMTFGNTTISYDPEKYFFLGIFDQNANLKYHLHVKHYNYIMPVRISKNGETYIAGTLHDTIQINGQLLLNTDTTDKMYVVKLDPAYHTLWTKILDLSTLPSGFCVDNNGNLIMAGHFQHDLYYNNSLLLKKGNQNYDAYVIKLSPAGHLTWARQLFGALTVSALGVDNYNNIYTAGSFGDTLRNGSFTATFPCYPNSCLESYATKFSPAGTAQWLTQIGKVGSEDQFYYKFSPQGNTYFTNSMGARLYVGTDSILSPNQGNYYDALIARLDPSGKMDWSYLPKDREAWGSSIAIDENGDMVWGGMAKKIVVEQDSIDLGFFSSAMPRVFMAHFNDTSAIQETGLAMHATGGGSIRLYPNPSDGRFSIVSTAPSAALHVCIYDLTGSSIYSKKIENKSEIAMGQVPAGVYFIVATDENLNKYRSKLIIR
jgi:hypothetical protein